MRSDHDPPVSTPPPDARFHPVWALAGLVSLGLGMIGIFLPVLPTTPLVILAAFCFGKGSPRLRRWIAGHRTFGPIIEQWERTGAIPRRVKYLACTVMVMTFVLSAVLGVGWAILTVQAIGMSAGAAYVLSRPDL